jgi:hypothetical protein
MSHKSSVSDADSELDRIQLKKSKNNPKKKKATNFTSWKSWIFSLFKASFRAKNSFMKAEEEYIKHFI